MSLPEIQMLWVRGALSKLEQLSIVSHLQNGHPVRLFSYAAIPNLPKGTVWEDARAILPESEVFTNPSAVSHGNLSTFSNFFRYHLLLQRGGIWSDCDSVCLKPLAFAADMDYFFATERQPEQADGQSPIQVQTGVFKAPAGSAVVARALEIAQATDLMAAPWASTGPRAMHQSVAELDLGRFVLAPEVFCPIGWWQVPALISGLTMLPANAFAVHFYNEIWRRNFFDKNADYDALSLFERLKARYLGREEDTHA
ncbi:MAG: glycosyltransferase [Sulfuritalea sp.]|nr:glycosyltransferase [Sulfuritalea sp.]MDP1984975.1 glycosyltransferase [Sulfuritalea sp.]